jgi:hypothetical protein
MTAYILIGMVFTLIAMLVFYEARLDDDIDKRGIDKRRLDNYLKHTPTSFVVLVIGWPVIVVFLCIGIFAHE